MRRRVLAGLLGAVLVSGPARAVVPPEVEREARIQLGEERYLRIFLWTHFWARYVQNNPGSLVRGEERPETFDLGLRSARLVLFGQVAPRIRVLFHLGVNNQSSIGGGFTLDDPHRPQIYFHEAAGEYRVSDGEALYLGAGLHYWSGPMRASSASTVAFLGLDAPIFNWPGLDRTDQVGRHLGLYAKGKLLERLDYRVALNKPFITPGTPREDVADFDPDAETFVLNGYAKWDFLEVEPNVLPYLAGTSLGTKRVFNVGVGAYYSPGAMEYLRAGTARAADILLLAADAFLDVPVGGSAVTAYLVGARYDFGPNHLRSVGVMNPSTGLAPGVTSFAGPGNAAPLLGTGWYLFGQAGWLLPEGLGPGRLQPMASLWLLRLDALGGPMVLPEVGLNWLLAGHHAKLTLVYRSRPVFQAPAVGKPVETSRRSEVVLQSQVYF